MVAVAATLPAIASAQVPSTPQPFVEQQRQQERERALREQNERTVDQRPQAAPPAPAQHVPESESPCFRIDRVLLVGEQSESFQWAVADLPGPEGNDSPIGRCLGTTGVNVVLARAQQAVIARGFVTTRVLAAPQDLSTGTLTLSPLHQRHIENLASMAKQGLFIYKGRGNVPEASFVSGECAMINTSSGFYGNVAKNAKFAYGLAPLPYYPDVPGAPQNTVIGGASLWVMSGKKPAEYKGVAKFFSFISTPEVQSASHKRTGYLPVTMASYKLTEDSGFYKQNPGTDVAVTQMIRKVTDKSRGIRLGNYVQIRAIEDEELEQVWNGKKTAKEALDAIVTRGNEQLERFQKANKS